MQSERVANSAKIPQNFATKNISKTANSFVLISLLELNLPGFPIKTTGIAGFNAGFHKSAFNNLLEGLNLQCI